MVGMEMAGHKIIDLRQTRELLGDVQNAFGVSLVLLLPTAIHQQGFLFRGDDKRGSSTFDVDEIDVESLGRRIPGSLASERLKSREKHQPKQRKGFQAALCFHLAPSVSLARAIKNCEICCLANPCSIRCPTLAIKPPIWTSPE